MTEFTSEEIDQFVAVTAEYDSHRAAYVAQVMGPAVIAEQFELFGIEKETWSTMSDDEFKLYQQQRLERGLNEGPTDTDAFIERFNTLKTDFTRTIARLDPPEPYQILGVEASFMWLREYHDDEIFGSTSLDLKAMGARKVQASKRHRYSVIDGDSIHGVKELEPVTDADWDLLRQVVGQIAAANVRLREAS